MAQHFLLTPVARALADDEMQLALNRNEPLAYALFMLFRWGSLTEQVCPKCGAVDSHIPRPKHKQWRCRSCAHDFSLKSGSLIDGTKLPYWKVLKALFLWCMEPKGVSAITIARKCDTTYEAAYLLLHKFRWAFWNVQRQSRLKGTFEIDVVWVLKGQRPFNDRSPDAIKKRNEKRREKAVATLTGLGMPLDKAERKARSLIPLESERLGSNPKKQAILAIVQRNEDEGKKGSRFILGFPVPSESYEHVAPIVTSFIEPGSKLLTDGASAYTGLAAQYELEQINHDEFYSKGDGKHTNNVESCFSRWRRMEIGTHHKMNARTLHLFFADCAWREAERHTHPVERFTKALGAVAHAAICRTFKKYGHAAQDRAAKHRQISLRPIQRVQASALESVRAVLGGLEKLAAKMEQFLQLAKPAPTFVAPCYSKGTDTLLWSLGRRRKTVEAEVVMPAPMVFGLAPAKTAVYSFNVSGLLAHCLRA